MRQVYFSGFSNTPWRKVASAVRLKRVAVNKGTGLKRRLIGSSLIQQLGNIGDEDLVVIGYQSAALAIASAIGRGANPKESLDLWIQERDDLLQALYEAAERIILYDIDAAASETTEFALRLAARSGLEFASQKSIALPDIDVLDLELSERIVREDDAAFAGHIELDHSALVPGRPATSRPASEFAKAVIQARGARNRLTADIEACTASMLDAAETPEKLTSLTRRMGRSKLAERDGAFGALVKAIQLALRAQQKEMKALKKSAHSLTVELEALRAEQSLAQSASAGVFSKRAGERAAPDENAVEQAASRDTRSQLTETSQKDELLLDVLELSKAESQCKDEEIALLRDLLLMGAEISRTSLTGPIQHGDDDRADEAERGGASRSSINHPATPSHVVLSRKSLRNPGFWLQTGLDYWLLKRSRLFDANWYLRRYPELARKKRDPILHYLLYGGREGRPASQHFCSAQYMQQNPDVRANGLNPLVHYLRVGRTEGRKTFLPSF